jgi:hypothetical protein
MKHPARLPPIPAAIPQEGEVAQPTMQDPFTQKPSQEEVSSVDAITDEIFLYIYKDGYDEIVAELKKGDDLPKTVGTMSGNLVSNEVMMLEEEGGVFPQDMFIEAATQTVEQFTDIVETEKIKEFRNDTEVQVFMTEALTYAINSGVESEYAGIDNDYIMSTMENLLRGDMDLNATPISGTRVTEEVV